jgi:very-short-patch-repair endonuclease
LVEAARVPRPLVPAQLRDKPFTTATARDLGVSKRALQGSEWRHLFREVWVHASVEDSVAVRIAAARLVLGDEGFLCGLTAAWIHGIDVQDRRASLAWMGRPTGSWRRPRAGCLVREITVADDDLHVIDGTRITTPMRTAFDCARWLSLVEAVVVADALAHDGLITPDGFAAYVEAHPGLRGVVRAREVARLMEPLTESPMESRLRLLLIKGGLGVPIAQYEVRDVAGRFVARADFAYPERRVIVEYDGAQHWDQRRQDDRRRDAMRALGWTVLVASRSDYYASPQAFVGSVRRAFAAAA